MKYDKPVTPTNKYVCNTQKFMDVWEWSLQRVTLFAMGPGIRLTQN